MATSESTPTSLDLTPWAGTFERRNLLKLNEDATTRDMIALADFLALQTLEIVEHWPTEKPIPIVLGENIRQLQAVLCHLENITRVGTWVGAGAA
jgi:hypothetical protein